MRNKKLLLIFALLYLSFGTEACYAQAKSDDIKKLLKERRDLLSEALDGMNKVFLRKAHHSTRAASDCTSVTQG